MCVLHAAVRDVAITTSETYREDDQVLRKQNFYRLRIHYINVTVYGELTRVLVEIKGFEKVRMQECDPGRKQNRSRYRVLEEN